MTYATNVPAYLQGETGDAKVTVDDFGGGTKMINVTGSGTLTVGVESVALTLPANVEANFDGNKVTGAGSFDVPKGAEIT